jgi:heterodisulfide reductase subunit C
MDRGFMEEVAQRSGQNFQGCYHCLSCAGGCPVVEAMDYNPNQIIRLMQFGRKREVLESRTIWLCVGCFSCLAQCPNKVNIPAMMDALRAMALESKVRIAEPAIWAFHREFLREVRNRGRVFELGFMMRYKLSTGRLFDDMNAGVKMVLKGRFHLLPSKVRHWNEMKTLLGG